MSVFICGQDYHEATQIEKNRFIEPLVVMPVSHFEKLKGGEDTILFYLQHATLTIDKYATNN